MNLTCVGSDVRVAARGLATVLLVSAGMATAALKQLVADPRQQAAEPTELGGLVIQVVAYCGSSMLLAAPDHTNWYAEATTPSSP